MRISRRRFYRRVIKVEPQRYRVNEWIRVPEVRLIDETGAHVGVVPTAQAIARAREHELDLVEVQPLANPPVAKILSFSKLKYEEDKERKREKARQKKVEIKGVRLSLRIGQHDREVRLTQAQQFLGNDDKVRIELILRGRERQHKDLAEKIIQDFISTIHQTIPVKVEQGISAQGGKLSTIIAKE
ncbi:MAG: translation initiation factor IF-3 [Patescibacteria group bacterium]|nr:translation initiation factor IF-3 [Patescibacteria group bacterium]